MKGKQLNYLKNLPILILIDKICNIVAQKLKCEEIEYDI